MEPITLILAALVAGSTSRALDALSDEAKDPVKAASAKLYSLLSKRLADDAAGERALDEYVRQPEPHKGPLEQTLADSGAAEDLDLLGVAQRVLELVDAGGAAKGRYNVSITAAHGVQIGSYNTQVNTFNYPPSRESTGR
jgi:RIP homotypic interaction motif